MINTIKTTIRGLLGERNFGRLEYVFKPKLASSWGGPFNGQQHRRRIFNDLVKNLDLQAIVETGTFRGTTTSFLLQTGLPVHTVELMPRYFGYSQMRLLRHRSQVHLNIGDSREFLARLARNKDVPKSRVLFYLDAHWEDDLPLLEELQIIFGTWRESVVLVDDFQVPGTDYGFDDYGPGKTLNLEYLEPLSEMELQAYFPSVDANEETGSKRGCVVLCQDKKIKDILDNIESIRR